MAVIHLLDRLTPGRRIVENQVFDRDLVRGPAMVAILDDGCVFEDCELPHPFDAQFVEVEDGRYLAGAVGLRNVTFRRCLLRHITFVGTGDQKQTFADSFPSS